MATLEQITDEGLKAVMQEAHAALRAGDFRGCIEKSCSAYTEYLSRNAKLQETEAAAVSIPASARRTFGWPQLGVRLVIEEGQRPRTEFEKQRYSFSDAISYYEYILDRLAARPRQEEQQT